MSLPIEWIEGLFKRMLGIYGNRFTRMWEGLEIEDVKRQWAAELANSRGESLKYALEHLPESMPPTLLEFKRLCSQAPESSANLLPAPKLDREQALKRATELRVNLGGDIADSKAWARRILKRVEHGARLPLAHIRMARQALGIEA